MRLSQRSVLMESSVFRVFREHVFLPDTAVLLIRIRRARGIATTAVGWVGPSRYGLGLFFLF